MRTFLSILVLAPVLASAADDATRVTVGSKAFTESVILGEVVVQIARHQGYEAAHKQQIGGTRLVWEALLAGQVDVYPEYTGTMTEEILADQHIDGEEALHAKLAELGLRMTRPLGFNNTYAIGMKEERAEQLAIRTISDLQAHPELRLRFSNEFMQRGDGWPSLSARYQLPHADVRGLEHALAYAALDQGAIDVTDLYATDAKIRAMQLRILEDDRAHFPRYDAVFVFREDLRRRAPDLVQALHSLEGQISDAQMVGLNASVEIQGLSEAQAAADFLARTLGIKSVTKHESTIGQVVRHALEHLNMVGVSLLAAVLVAVPLGIIAAYRANLAQPILAVTGIIQTIPAIALLVLLIRPIGYFVNDLGYPQVVVALFLYSLLPIVRNTYTGLQTISPQLRESAIALGLPPLVRLWRIELPLASRTILAGIKTAAVINVGFATLGGLIGAGGFGEPIFAGIRRQDDYTTIVLGALPAAALAMIVQGAFELAERVIVPRGLRIKPAE